MLECETRNAPETFVLWAVRTLGPMTDHALLCEYQRRRVAQDRILRAVPEETILPALSRLIRDGLVVDTGHARCLSSGRYATIWQAAA